MRKIDTSGRSLIASLISRNKVGIAAVSIAGVAAAIGSTGLAQNAGNQAASAQALVEQTCSSCHSYALATSRGRTHGEWTDIVQQMVALGAPLNATQATAAVDYLAQAYPAETVAAAFPAAPTSMPEQRFPRPDGPNQWPAYGGGGDNRNFSPLNQITPQNVANLQPAWVYHYGAGRHEEGDQGWISGSR